jgi:hypothetical protein
MNGRWIALAGAGLLAAIAGSVHFVGQIGRAPTYKALPVVPAIEVPGTLVPLTLSPATPEGDELFGSRLMQFGIALDRASRDSAAASELPTLEAPLIRSELSSVLGPDAAASLRELAVVAKTSANAPPFDQPSITALDMAVARLDGNLLAAKLPYFVDATVMTDVRGGVPRRVIVLSEFSVAESNLYSTSDGPVRTVRLRKLDRLHFKHGSLGFVNPHRAQAAVLLDVVDEEVARHLLPTLDDGAPMPLVPVDRTRRGAPAGGPIAELAARAGELARAELGALPGIDRGALGDLGDAFQRRVLYEKWNDRLGGEAAAKAYASIRDAFADSIEHHEVQHRLDLKRGAEVEPLPVPAPVAAAIGGEGEHADDLRDAVKNELSGYVAQLAHENRLPRTTLALLLRFLVNPRTRTSTEGYAARIATEELCRVLAIRDVTPLVHDGRLDEERLARAYRELTNVPPAALTAAAAAVWHDSFGRTLAGYE